MNDRPGKTATPDGTPRRRAKNSEQTANSAVSGVQDPLIAGDAGKGGRRNRGEAAVDAAGQIRRRDNDVDLLH